MQQGDSNSYKIAVSVLFSLVYVTVNFVCFVTVYGRCYWGRNGDGIPKVEHIAT